MALTGLPTAARQRERKMENDKYKELKEAWEIFEREIWTIQPFKIILKLAEKILDWLEKKLKK